jgi:hypothetical protein
VLPLYRHTTKYNFGVQIMEMMSCKLGYLHDAVGFTTTTPPVTHPGGSTTKSMPSRTVVTVPASTPSNAKLPDPLHFVDGSPVTSKSQWDTRRDEINQLYQRYEVGTFPPKLLKLSTTFDPNTLTVTHSDGSQTISFTASIKYPTYGQAPYPAIIVEAPSQHLKVLQ